jgi:[ribosomal protein S5]-alanine N-acetyltransferase
MHRISFIPFPYLTTERFILRQLTLSDGNEIFLLRSDKEINRYLDRPIAGTIDDARQFIDKINESILKNELIYWVIAYKGQPNLIGTICLWNISDNGTKAEIGFELLPEFHGKGIMHEVLPIIINYGFETMGLNFIDGEVDPKNLKSIKLMEKSGFIYHKRLENTEIYSVQNSNIKK